MIIDSSYQDSFFSVHLIAPTSGPVRMQYAQIVEGELPKIGINAELDLISWAHLGPRCTDAEVGAYKEDGYDIACFGMSLGTPTGHPGDSMQAVFGADSIPPAGFNVIYWAPGTDSLGRRYLNYRANESNQLIKEINENLNLTEVKEDLKTWQKIWYDVMPNIIVYNQYEVHAIGAGLLGYDPVNPYPLVSIEDMWTTADYKGGDQVVLAASTGGQVFNPMIATDVYDQYMSWTSFDGLYGRTPSKEVVLPTGTNKETWMTDNYGTTEHLKLYPRIATGMGNYSADGLTYQVDMQRGVYFHDGHEADMWDLTMSFQAQLIPQVAASIYSNVLVPFGMDNKTARHGNYSFTVTDANNDGHDERINISLSATFAPFEGDYVGQNFYPEHILGDPVNHGFNPTTGDFDPVNQWIVAPGDWGSHSTCTGRTSDPGGYPGPISIGPLIFKEFDTTTGFVTLEKFNQTRWDNATSQWINDPNVSFWNIDDLDKVPDTAKVIIATMDSALADLKTGGVNIMDPQFTMANILDELQAEPTIQAVLSPETGWQAMWLNPKFEQDGVYHLNKKGVRHAISHIIPRQAIIEKLLHGLGCPGYTPVPITSWAVISEADMVTYKKTLKAIDGSTPELSITTAYDEYSPTLAFDWLDTEGYNTISRRIEMVSKSGSSSVSTNTSINILYFLTNVLALSSRAPNVFFGGILLTGITSILIYQRKRKKSLD